jgi:hypothetical protein
MSMYRIIGADNRPYGPVFGEQLRQWIAEGRANAQTQTFVEGATEWKPLGTMPEFASHFAPPVPPPISPPFSGRARKTNSYAMTGMIFGILAFVCCCKFLFGALGIIFSLIGLSQISRHPELYEGRGPAITGLVLSILSLLLALVFILIALATGHFHFNWSFNRF